MTPRFGSLTVVLLVGSLIGLAALPARGATPSETPEQVVRQFLALAFEGRLEDLPRAANAQTQRFEQQMRNVLRVRCIRPDQIAISMVDHAADRATLHADVVMTKSSVDVPSTWSAVDFVPYRVVLVPEGGRWLVSEIHNRDEEFAAELLSRTGDERERFLFAHADRISKGLARVLYARALAYLNDAKYKEGADAAAMARRIAVDAGDRGGEALAMGAQSYIVPITDPAQVLALAEQALAIAETLGDPDVLARAWYDRGRGIRSNRWEPGDSLRIAERIACYRRAVEIAERAEDPTILVRALYSLANIAANSQSDPLTARRYIDRGLPIAREAGDVGGLMGFESILATIYFNQGDQERGLFHNERAMELAQKQHGFAYASLLVRSAFALINDDRFDEARAAFARILTTTNDGITVSKGAVPAPVLVSAVRALGVIEAESGNLSEAECLIRQGSVYNKVIPEAYLFDIAAYYSKYGNDRAALRCALASLAERGLYPIQQVAALIAAAQAYRNLGMTERAMATALEAVEIRETIDTRVAGDDSQRAFASNATSEAYEVSAEVSLDLNDPVQALAFLERGRARVLVDILENGRPGVKAEMENALQTRRAVLDREVVQATDDLERAVATGNTDRVGDLTARLSHARAVRASFLDGAQARAERQHAMRGQIDSAEILRRAAQLPPRTVAVAYFLGERDLHIFVIGRDATDAAQVQWRRQRVERKVLGQSVNELLQMLADGDLRVETASRAMYDILLRPIEKDIAGAEALLVIPDDFLWRVPFAALVDRRGRFLVERTSIVYAPSLTAYSRIVDSPRRRTGRPLSLFAIANPKLRAGATDTAASFYRGTTLGPLPDAEHEVEAVRKMYDRKRSLVLKRQDATEDRTKVALLDASVAHFATHAILDDANPMYSRLLLARAEDAPDDGWLESWEVARLDLSADLIVLSACDTARGRAGGGEGVVGLSWSFLIAGAQSIVATQWKVASDSTAAFMIAFHRSLRARKGDAALHKAESLREAQLHLIRDERTRHPFHWAPFVLLGDPSR